MSFKAHEDGRGPRLGRQVRLGPSGMARRFGEEGPSEAEPLSRGVQKAMARFYAKLAERRAVEAVAAGRVSPSESEGERSVAEQGTEKAGASVKGSAGESTGKRGRPKVAGVRPWEAEGLSRAAWYRRRKDGG